MYSHWQASLRTAVIVGAVLLLLLCTNLVLLEPTILTLTTEVRIAAIGVLRRVVEMTLVAVATRCGLYYSGIKGVGRVAVTAMSAGYLLLYYVVVAISVPSPYITLELQRPDKSPGYGLIVSDFNVIEITLVPLVLAFIVSFGVARTMRGRASVA